MRLCAGSWYLSALMLYLHEIIDIVGDGQRAYLDSIGERAAHSEGQGISRLMGSWLVVGSTGRWPGVVNLWEMDGWTHWAESLERQFLPEKQDPQLAPWWTRATQWRSGGVDRILEPAAYSPTRGQLQKAGLKAWACEHTLVRLRSGQRDAYLQAVGAQLRPLMEARGVALMGAYAVPMRSDEALVLWAARDFRTLCQLHEDREHAAALQQWTAHAAPMQRKFETMWLVPSPHCFFHPASGA